MYREEYPVSIGKIYRLSDKKLLAKVNYQLHNESVTNWWGELTLIDNVRINESDIFIIELEDKRKSVCNLKKRVNRAVSGVPTRYVYRINGVSALE